MVQLRSVVLALVSLFASTTLLVPGASALQLTPTDHYQWAVPSSQAWSAGFDPSAFAGAAQMTATDYLTVTVRTAQAGDKVAYTLTFGGQTFIRREVAGQTSGLHIARLPNGQLASADLGIQLIDAATTPTAQHVSISVCARRAASCPG